MDWVKRGVAAAIDRVVAEVRHRAAEDNQVQAPSASSTLDDDDNNAVGEGGGAKRSSAQMVAGFGGSAARVTSLYYVHFTASLESTSALIETLEEGAAADAAAEAAAAASASAASAGFVAKSGGDDVQFGAGHSVHHGAGSDGATAQRRSRSVYAEALSDAHEHFCAARLNLVSGRFREKLASIVSSNTGQTGTVLQGVGGTGGAAGTQKVFA